MKVKKDSKFIITLNAREAQALLRFLNIGVWPSDAINAETVGHADLERLARKLDAADR